MKPFTRPDREADLFVKVTLFPTDKGGRTRPLWQGCRVPHDFGLPGEMNDGMYEFQGEPPNPGQSAEAYLWLLVPERNQSRFKPGFRFSLWENKIFAQGEILRVINPELNKMQA